MPVKFTDTELPGVMIARPEAFEDERGFFLETFHKEKYADGGINRSFVQDNHSHSKKGVLRGLHYQVRHAQAKLIYVAAGEIFDAAVDIRRGSPAFGKWTSTILSAENRRQIFVPEGFAHGFCVLSESADVTYKCSDFYYPDDDRGILWSDAFIGIKWPIAEPVLSAKDRAYPKLREIPEGELPVYQK